VGTSTTTKLVAGGWTSSVGWRYSLEADLDLSGRIFRNGQLYTLDGTPDVYWTRNGSNIWFADGNVGIGVIDPAYPLDVAGRIRCFGVDVIQGPGPQVSTGQGQYVSPWQYAGSNIYYGQGGAAIGPGVSSVLNGVSWDVSGPVRIRFGPTYMSSLGVGIPYGSTLSATADIFGSLRTRSLAVDSTGVFGGRVTARDFLSLSDQRFKKNIEVLSDPHSLLESIRGVRFDWIDSQKRDLGLVAQDVLKTLPEAVEGDEEKGFHVAYDKVIPVLLEAIKNLNKRVETLEKRLQTV
jgi:prepilin-type processing-associated H-X9-DG protein